MTEIDHDNLFGDEIQVVEPAAMAVTEHMAPGVFASLTVFGITLIALTRREYNVLSPTLRSWADQVLEFKRDE